MTARQTSPRALGRDAIRRLRPAKPSIDASRPLEVIDEDERLLDGGFERCRTVFLAGAECPFTCVYCDLWRFTLDEATPDGALVRQLELALADDAGTIACLKLYNASNFFEPRAVPVGDLPAISRLASGFDRVVVECHPRLIDARVDDFASRLSGRLELALGLETVHPQALPLLGKEMTVGDFDRACDFALQRDHTLRAFVLIGTPFVATRDQERWVRRTVEHALRQGVRHIALVPLRGGNGAVETLAARGDLELPTPELIERSLDLALASAEGRAVVSLDLWDIEQHFRANTCCADRRIARLGSISRQGTQLPRVDCTSCGGSAA